MSGLSDLQEFLFDFPELRWGKGGVAWTVRRAGRFHNVTPTVTGQVVRAPEIPGPLSIKTLPIVRRTLFID